MIYIALPHTHKPESKIHHGSDLDKNSIDQISPIDDSDVFLSRLLLWPLEDMLTPLYVCAHAWSTKLLVQRTNSEQKVVIT